MNIAINGFGRIGRATLKAILEKKSNHKVVAINDLTDPATLAHLFKYDSVYGVYQGEVKATKDSLIVGNKKFKILAEREPANLPWKELAVDIVIESTGFFRTKEKAGEHLKAGAKKVIISAPGKGDDIKSIVLGVNEDKVKKTDKVLSMASCTTNCLSPLTDVIRKEFGIAKAIMTTIHAYTADQNIVDGPHSDLRRARAAAVNIVPTTTGAAKATTETIPSLKGKFDGMAVRVPVSVGSLCDVTFLLKKNTTKEDINKAIVKATKTARLKNILTATNEPIVSSDIIGNPASSIVDLECTCVVGGNLAKIVSWYDNEWGYSNRLADFVDYLDKKKIV